MYKSLANQQEAEEILKAKGIILAGTDDADHTKKARAEALAKSYREQIVKLSQEAGIQETNKKGKLDELLANFRQAFLERPIINIKAAGDFTTSVMKRASMERAEAKFEKNPFEHDIGKTILKSIGEDSEGVKNLKAIVLIVANSTYECGVIQQLVYHSIAHAIEMLHDPGHLAKLQGLEKNWSFFISICGIFHDAIFNRSRVVDENESVDLMIQALQPFIDKLSSEDQVLFKEMIHSIIVGGTTPIFFKQADGTTRMLPLWQFSEYFLPQAGYKDKTHPMLEGQRCMATADVQRSGIPALLAHFPVDNSKMDPVADPDHLSTLKGILRPIAEKIAGKISIPGAKEKLSPDDILLMILTKIGQGTRFFIEGKMDPSKSLSHTMLKMATEDFLRSPQTFTSDDLEAILKQIKSEFVFTGNNQSSLDQFNIKGMKPLSYSFRTDSWAWHREALTAILNEFNQKLNEPPADYSKRQSQLTHELCENAGAQQGRRPNMVSLAQEHLGITSKSYESADWFQSSLDFFSTKDKKSEQLTPLSTEPVTDRKMRKNSISGPSKLSSGVGGKGNRS